jgi:hypothetical protein
MATKKFPQVTCYQFSTSAEAWRFVRALRSVLVTSGFPDLKTNSVQVSDRDVDIADRIYAFSGGNEKC